VSGRRGLFWLLLACVLLFAGLLLGASLPLPLIDIQLHLPADRQVGLHGAQLAWPTVIRSGETRNAALHLEAVDSSQMDKTGNLLIETRLELPGAVVSPAGAIRQPLIPGKGLVFNWQIRVNGEGSLGGTLWIYRVIIPVVGDTDDRQVVLAFPLEVKAATVLGMPVGLARWIGGIGLMISMALLAYWLPDIMRIVLRK
jgi:hypothetical protein